MANEEEVDVMVEGGDSVEVQVDNANALTSGLVFATSGILLLAFIIMEMALNHWFKVGLFASK